MTLGKTIDGILLLAFGANILVIIIVIIFIWIYF